MSVHKYFDRICCFVLAIVIILTVFLMNGESTLLSASAKSMGYEEKLFDNTRVHTLDIVMNDWQGFIDTCENEEYEACSVVIDGEAFKNVGIRAKGNTSLSSVSAYGNNRYSFKIEFDKYDSSKSYYGLDKISLNNIIQDNTYMKDFLVYTMMGKFGAASPLCSYVYITVNGEDFGLYIAVEAIEESFLIRNYGNDYGELYKPDSMDMGGGRGNGRDFDMEDISEKLEDFRIDAPESFDIGNKPDMGEMPNINEAPNMEKFPEMGSFPDMNGGSEGRANKEDGKNGFNFGNMPGGFGGGMGESDVKLQYIDDDPESYSSIFESAKTDITEADKKRLIASLKTLSSGNDIENAVDIEAVIRYFVVHNFVCNSDSYTGSIIHNYYLYEKDGIMSMLPWDYNLAFGGMNGGDAESTVNSPINSPVSGGVGEDRPMIHWIFSNEEYTKLYEEYFDKFISELFDSGYVSSLITYTTEMISPYVEKDPTKFCSYEKFAKGASTIFKFASLRAESVKGQLGGIIGKTSETQDKSDFVSASGINLSDMGSMGGGGFGGGRPDRENGSGMNMPSEGGFFGENGGNPDFAENKPSEKNENGNSQNTVSPSENENTPSENIKPSDGAQRPNRGNTENFDIGNSASDEQPKSNNWLILGVSAALLVLGIAIAFLFKGREM